MKRIICGLLGLVLFCTIFAGTATSSMAFAPTKRGIVTGYDELKQMIGEASSGSTLTIYVGRIFFKNEIVIDEPITIKFKRGYTSGDKQSALYGGNEWRIFKITSDKVHLEFDEVAIEDAKSDGGGGAIYIDGEDVSIKGGDFKNCNSAKEKGGAIFVNDDDVTIENCSFDECKAYGVGGAIYIDGEDVSIKGSNFTNCNSSTDNGGAIFVADDDDTVENCSFNGCSAVMGGAISLHSGAYYNLNVKNCTFANCSASKNGQWVDGSDDTIITNCTQPYSEENYYECEFEDDNTAPVPADGQAEIIEAVAAESEEVPEEAVEPPVEPTVEDVDEEGEAELTGSVISGGQVGIIIAVIAVAIVAVVILAMSKKKNSRK